MTEPLDDARDQISRKATLTHPSTLREAPHET